MNSGDHEPIEGSPLKDQPNKQEPAPPKQIAVTRRESTIYVRPFSLESNQQQTDGKKVIRRRKRKSRGQMDLLE